MTACPSSTDGPKHKSTKTLNIFMLIPQPSTDLAGKNRKLLLSLSFLTWNLERKTPLFYFFPNYKLSVVNTTASCDKCMLYYILEPGFSIG